MELEYTEAAEKTFELFENHDFDTVDAYDTYEEDNLEEDFEWDSSKVHDRNFKKKNTVGDVRKYIRAQVYQYLPKNCDGVVDTHYDGDMEKQFRKDDLAAIHKLVFELLSKARTDSSNINDLENEVERYESMSRLEHLKKAIFGR